MKNKPPRQLFSDFNEHETQVLRKHATTAVAEIALCLLDTFPKYPTRDCVQVCVTNAILRVCRELTATHSEAKRAKGNADGR